ncbi:hypothetical protein [Terracoccus sp. 273MFTsu3.1]|uniref:hypothetical protein n=1 Tax=Terracoccus sp. 273MFTsu3.1 TaxID=1172188 RepID=UPI0003623E0E|nr:hypothetical protein [Terracoccus sp. 273MFTsu3.1]
MAKHIEYTKTIEKVERLRSSTNGNPRWLVTFTDGATAKTQRDSSVGYSIDNRTNLGVPVLVKATPAGEIWGVEPVEP